MLHDVPPPRQHRVISPDGRDEVAFQRLDSALFCWEGLETGWTLESWTPRGWVIVADKNDHAQLV